MKYKVTYSDNVIAEVEADSFNEAARVALNKHAGASALKIELIAGSVFEDIFRAFKMI